MVAGALGGSSGSSSSVPARDRPHEAVALLLRGSHATGLRSFSSGESAVCCGARSRTARPVGPPGRRRSRSRSARRLCRAADVDAVVAAASADPVALARDPDAVAEAGAQLRTERQRPEVRRAAGGELHSTAELHRERPLPLEPDVPDLVGVATEVYSSSSPVRIGRTSTLSFGMPSRRAQMAKGITDFESLALEPLCHGISRAENRPVGGRYGTS
jgi:hypothetical protein